MAVIPMNELDILFKGKHSDCKPWLIGKIPKHFKRLSVDDKEALRLAKLGATEIASAFGEKLFFCQAMIAGAILSGDYDEIVVCLCSQYGKSWLLGRVGLLEAYRGHKQYITGAAANVTSIIMGHVVASTQTAAPEIRNALLNKRDELDRLATSVSKQRLAFSTGGFVEAITLGDTYNDNIATNKAVGRAGDFYIDEASLVSDAAMSEMGRREFAKIDGTKYKQIMISNPHRPGVFYDKLTEENIPARRFVLWADALTAVEEERFTEELVRNSDFAKHKSTLRRYLLCVLDTDGSSMFGTPQTYEAPYEGEYTQYFLGVDAAYKGKDNICVALTAVGGNKVHVEDVQVIDKKEWIDGVTSKDIIDDITRVVNNFGVAMTCVDVGWGVWLVEGLAQKGINVRGISFSGSPTKERQKAKHYSATNAENKRAEMHLDLQNLIDEGTLEMSEQAFSKCKDVLPFITAERKSSGKIRIREKAQLKQDIGKSPDELDAILLSIHAAILFLGESVVTIP